MCAADKNKENTPLKGDRLSGTVGKKAARRIRARRTRDKGVWFGIGLFGMVGWTVAITTLIGVAIGVWIDRTWPSNYSWTLMLLFIGLIMGCLNAWYWINKESRLDDDEIYDDDEHS